MFDRLWTSNAEDRIPCHSFLCEDANGCNHGETTVEELLVLHCLQFFGVLGLEAQWVKAEVTWNASATDRPFVLFLLLQRIGLAIQISS